MSEIYSQGDPSAIMNYEMLEKRITNWAKNQGDVRAVVVIGSRAREDHVADAWSDLDLILFVTDPQVYVEDTSWLAAFGEVWLPVFNFTGAGDFEWLVLFEGGLKVDFILAPVAGQLSEMLFDSFYGVATRRGLRILLDKNGDGFLETSRLMVDPDWVQPDPDAFAAVLNQCWLSIYRASSMTLRGELWRARAIADGSLRHQLLQLLEWHAKARKGATLDTWYDGRFMADWVDPQVLALLPEIFASFDAADSKRAILASMTLADRLGRQTAEKWGYPYPIKNQIRIQEWIEAAMSM
ncbi:MAG: hypothetical protein GWP61_07250 [Chloroflexi bacterium]|nr:hypothetical protein [Chloroflexota bacterium]